MATPATTAEGTYGVSETLSGYTIESCNTTKTPVREPVPNQKNQVCKEIRYDTRTELRMVLRGANEPANTTITVAGVQYIVDSVEKAGTYNGLQRWSVTAHKYEYCDTETALS